MRPILISFLLLAACGSGEAPPANQVDLPQPSGPPVAQQADAVPSTAPKGGGLRWEMAASGEGSSLRLTGADGKLLLSIACLGSPPRLSASVPAFTPVGSEDRFTLGLGEEAVTLVADPTRQAQPGVGGEGPAPENLAVLLDNAKQVSANYGAQQLGPHPAPPEPLRQSLAKACGGSE